MNLQTRPNDFSRYKCLRELYELKVFCLKMRKKTVPKMQWIHDVRVFPESQANKKYFAK